MAQETKEETIKRLSESLAKELIGTFKSMIDDPKKLVEIMTNEQKDKIKKEI